MRHWFLPEVPPICIVTFNRCLSTKHTPAPLINKVSKRKEGNLFQSHFQQVVDVTLYGISNTSSVYQRFTLYCKYHFEHLSLTSIIGQLFQKANGVQMFRCGHRKRQHIPYSLMEARIGSSPEADRLVFILEVIFHVAHLMMHGEKLLHGHSSALFDSKQNPTQTFSCLLLNDIFDGDVLSLY